MLRCSTEEKETDSNQIKLVQWQEPTLKVKFLATTLFLAVASCLSNLAWAGSRDAYLVLVIDLDGEKTESSKRLVEEYFSGRFPEHFYDCAVNSGGKFELSYLRTRPKPIVNSLVSSALTGSDRSLRKVQKALRDYEDHELKDGFDFLLTYRATKTGIELAAISADAGQRTIRQNIEVELDPKNVRTQAAVAGAICQLSGAMPFVVGP